MIKLIGIAGKKRSGKNTFGDAVLNYETTRSIKFYSFAKTIKRDLMALQPYATARANDMPKEVTRPMEQHYGDLCKAVHGDSYFVLSTLEEARKDYLLNDDIVQIITDVRFPAEARMIRLMGGYIVKIDRPGIEGETDNHNSETGVDRIYDCYAVIENSGTLPEYRESCVEVYRNIMSNFTP